MNKNQLAKNFEKPIIRIFIEVRFVVKQQRVTDILNQKIWNSMEGVLRIKLLTKHFDYINLSLLGWNKIKSINKI